MTIECIVKNKNVSVELIKENVKTVIVALPDGNIIKRHKTKHHVSPMPFTVDGHRFCKEESI